MKTYSNIFTQEVAESIINRIQKLSPETQPQWGKMNVAQMLAHCNVAYDMAFTDKYPKPSSIARFLLKIFVKSGVCGPKPYPKNQRTAPTFIVADDRNFEEEKNKLITYIEKCYSLGSSHFEGKESLSFGPLTSQEWSTMFHKHLDHHLSQFSV
jgi:hypothetical protein